MISTTQIDYAYFLKQLNGVIKTIETYPLGHPLTLPAVDKCYNALKKALEQVDQITVSWLGNRIMVNGDNIEGSQSLKRLLEESVIQNLHSLTFHKELTKNEFAIYLNFFVIPNQKEAAPKSLSEYLEANRIHSIQVDQVRFELVTKDDVVVKSEVLEGVELKNQISQIIRDNPEFVKDIILNRFIRNEGVQEKFGPNMDLKELSAQIKNQVKELSDDDLMNLLISGLEPSPTGLEPRASSSTLNEVLDLVYKILEDRERMKLLPQIKNMLSEHGLIEKKHLDFIFDERWLKSQEVLDELVRMMDKLGTEEVDLKRLMFLWHRVIDTQEPKIKTYAIDMLLSQIDSENSETRGLAIDVVKDGLNQFIQKKMEVEFSYVTGKLLERLKNQLLPTFTLEGCSELLKIGLTELIGRGEFQDALHILVEYNNRQSTEIAYPEGTKELASGFIRDVTDDTTLAYLTGSIKEGVPMVNIKLVEEILESLDKDKVAERLVSIFTVSDRATRMSALRVLNRLGRSSVSAISSFLSNLAVFAREKDRGSLVNDSWYKMRNAIYVLGNIPDDNSMQVLSQLSKDPDIRVRLEVVKVLEKLHRDESVNVLLTFLSDPEDEVRKSAIASLGWLNDERCLTPLIEHFRNSPDDKLTTLIAIGKIGNKEIAGEGYDPRTIRFLLALLSEEEAGVKPLPPKQKDEIQIAALSILSRVGDPELADGIEKFIKKKKRGLKGLLTNERLVKAAYRTLKTMKSKGVKTPSPEPD